MKQETKSEYEVQAEDFLQKTGTKFEAKFLKYDRHFDDDKEKRDIYEIMLTKGKRVFKFNFGNSVNASGKYICYPPEGKTRTQKPIIPYGDCSRNKDFKAPTAYDVLACLQKNDVGSFEDFCSDFGYDTDSRKAEKSYKVVLNEWNNVKMLYNDAELEMLGEIQ